ncbi:MAG: aminotransferase class IV [Proteobacteria bacterium]|nr:aminotransferase class IV [Pseudomonadota bacterium]
MKVFLNGEFIEEGAAALPVTDRGFTLGDGVFDTMLAADGSLVDADAHFNRLLKHAAVLKIPVNMDVEALKKTAHRLIGQPASQRAAIRTTVSRGPGERGLTPPESPQQTILMRVSPASDPSTSPPPHLVIAETVRRNEHSPLSRIKSLNYGDNILALMEARGKGTDDAIILNTAGKAACATAANIFVLIGGELFTPPVSDGAMPGITRQKLLPKAIEKSLGIEDMMEADSIYLTSSILGIRAAKSLNGRKLLDLYRNFPIAA